MNVPNDSTTPGPDAEAADVAPTAPRREVPTAEILPYVLPVFAYVTLGGIESYLPHESGQLSPVWYPVAYSARALFIAAMAVYFRSIWKDFRPMPGVGPVILSVLAGLVVTVLWVGLDGLYPDLPMMGKRTAFDPMRMSHAGRFAFYGVRLFGLVLVVPVIEELFWRSFLIRWLIEQDFRSVPIGKVTLFSAAASSVLFALAHPEWLPALLTGLLWAGLLHQTRSLACCLISHATANLALGLYVIQTGAWKFW
jgi:uncharacterized protein